MPLGTLDRTPPPFFKQGTSALTKLVVFSAFAVFIMVADARLHLLKPARAVLATALYPLQSLVLHPLQWLRQSSSYFESLAKAQSQAEQAQRELLSRLQKAGQAEQLLTENARLRELLGLRQRLSMQGQAAQVLYDAADPYVRKLILDQGQVHGLQEGSPVLDEHGVLGQLTRVYPLISEITLLTDREQAIPVLNTRTGARAVAFGDPNVHSGALELRFMAANADVQPGDLLTTSGVDGVYPPGLPVARVDKVERRGDSAFARIVCTPLARVDGALHVLVLPALNAQLPAPPGAPGSKPEGAKK